MKKIVLLLLLASVVAFEVPENCVRTETLLACDEAWDVEGVAIQFSEDFECHKEFVGGEFVSIGCYGDATLVTGTEFLACKTKIPLLPGGEIDYDNVKYAQNCAKKTWPAGASVTVLVPQVFLDDCVRSEGDEFYEKHSCPVSGKKLSVSGVASEEDARYLQVEDAEEASMAFPWYYWAVAFAVIFAIVFKLFYKKKK